MFVCLFVSVFDLFLFCFLFSNSKLPDVDPASAFLIVTPSLNGDFEVCRVGPWSGVLPRPPWGDDNDCGPQNCSFTRFAGWRVTAALFSFHGYNLIGSYLVHNVSLVTVSATRNPSRLRSTRGLPSPQRLARHGIRNAQSVTATIYSWPT